MKKILIINGPNLNLTGTRKTDVYGTDTLADIVAEIKQKGEEIGFSCDHFQSNHEGAIIDKLHAARSEYDGIVINAGAYTHYSYAIRDAIEAIELPCIEVHMSDIHKREEFRHVSVISPVCRKQICGLGKNSYIQGLYELKEILG